MPASICSSVTPAYWRSAAILRRFSPRSTVCCPGSAVAAGAFAADATGAALADAAVSTGLAAGALATGASCRLSRTVSTTLASTVLRALAAGENSGGSRRKVYSRTRRPVGQFSSTRKSRNGSFTGRPEEILSTALPPLRFSTLKLRSFNTLEYSTPAWLNTSAGARRAVIPLNSSGVAESVTSARKGCPRPDSTVNLPSPAACAEAPARDMPAATASASAHFLNLEDLFSITAMPCAYYLE